MATIVKRGSKGGHVLTLNMILYGKGFKSVPDPKNPQGAVEFTVETEKAVKVLQKRYGMKPTGACNVDSIIFALGKKPADFMVNPTDFRSAAKGYESKNQEHLKKADRLVKDISDEQTALIKRLRKFRDQFGQAITNDFLHAVGNVEGDWKRYQASNDAIERYETAAAIREWEGRAKEARTRADQEVAIAAKYIKELESVLGELKKVCK